MDRSVPIRGRQYQIIELPDLTALSNAIVSETPIDITVKAESDSTTSTCLRLRADELRRDHELQRLVLRATTASDVVVELSLHLDADLQLYAAQLSRPAKPSRGQPLFTGALANRSRPDLPRPDRSKVARSMVDGWLQQASTLWRQEFVVVGLDPVVTVTQLVAGSTSSVVARPVGSRRHLFGIEYRATSIAWADGSCSIEGSLGERSRLDISYDPSTGGTMMVNRHLRPTTRRGSQSRGRGYTGT